MRSSRLARRRRSLVPLAAAALIAAAARSAAPHAYGPPPGHTGGFGEPTCRVCHQSEPLNAPGGSLGLEGLPEHCEPGRRYDLAVALRRPGMGVAGFQLAARFADDTLGRQAGTLQAVQRGTAVVRDSARNVSYAQHTAPGQPSAPDGLARWTVRWQAPASGGRVVVVHVAANAAGDDNSPVDDFIYAGAWRCRLEARGDGGDEGDGGDGRRVAAGRRDRY